MSTRLYIGGSLISLSQFNAYPVRLNQRFTTYSTLTIQRRGGALPGLPDPWLGKSVLLQMDLVTPGTFVNVFQGDIVSVDPSYGSIGWVNTYQCLDLKRRCDLVPMTDSNTLTDTAAYNLQPDDIFSLPDREGRNVGQILTDVLTMVDNATGLDAHGVGAYVSLGPPPVLPASTIADLATLTIIPPSGVYIQGEKLIAAIEAFCRFWAPNYFVWIQPTDGAIRFLDKRTFTNHTLTLGTDPIDPTPLRRSVQDNFQRVIVRGQPVAEPKLVTELSGGLAQDFAWGTYTTNAAAIAAWTPDQYRLDKQAKSNGTCTCTDTLDVVVTPTDATEAWVSDYWDQTSTGHLGQIYLYHAAGSGIDMFVSRRIVANAALTGGGSANVVVDIALPATNYDHYSIYGISNGSGMVWRKYKVVDPDIAAAMTKQFTYPAIWTSSGGGSAVSTSFPMGSVCYSASGSPPFQEFPAWFDIDPSSGHIYFQTPTYITAGNHVPSDVRALLAVNTGHLMAIYPPDSGGPVYGGTSNSVEGLTDTLTVTVGEWRDPINLTNMIAYAHDLFDSVKDTIVEGSVLYHGLYVPGMTPGIGLSVTGNGYTTGWEGLNLEVLECELTWNNGEAAQHTTVMHCSNRRAHFTAAAFMRPDRPVGGQQIGGGIGWNPFQAFQPSFAQMYNLAAAGPRQTQIPDPTLGMFSDMAEDNMGFDVFAGMDEEKEYRKHGRKATYADKQRAAQRERAMDARQEQQAKGQENRLARDQQLRGNQPTQDDEAFAAQQQMVGAGMPPPLTRQQQRQRRAEAQEEREFARQNAPAARTQQARDFEARQKQKQMEEDVNRAGSAPNRDIGGDTG